MKKPKHHCPDCGGAPVNHSAAYISVLISAIVEPWTNWVGKIIPESSFDWLGPAITKILTFFRLGIITYEPKSDDSGRTRVLWEEAIKRGIKMCEFHLFVSNTIYLYQNTREKKDSLRFFPVLKHIILKG